MLTEHTNKRLERINLDIKEILFISITLIFISFSSIYSYLLFHSIVELFSIIIAGGVFLVGWTSRKYMKTPFFLVIGISSAFIAVIDLIHTLAYPGMNIFLNYNANLATSLWIAARYLQAGSYLAASLLIKKSIKPKYLLLINLIAVVGLLFLIFAEFFPVCYIEGFGLTPFKIISEYIIDLIFFACLLILIKNRDEFDKKVFILIISSIIATIIAELEFTFYIGVYDISNFFGHIFKVISFYLLFKSIIQIGIEEPFNLLFRKIKEAEDRYHTAFEESPDGIVIFEFDSLKVSEFNEAICKLLGYSRKEFEKLKINDYDVNESPSETRAHMEKVLKEGFENFETKFRTKNGEIKDIFVTAKVIRISEKNYFQSIFRDVTEQKKAQELRTRLASIVESSEDAIIGKTLEGTITSWNKAAEKIYYYTAEEMIGKSIELLSPPNLKEEIFEFLNRIKNGEKIEGFETERMRKDGTKANVSLTISPIKDINNKIIGASTIARDITEKKKAEEKIQNLSKFPSENPNPVLRVDDKKIIYTNKIGKNLFNITEGGAVPEILKEPITNSIINKNIQELDANLNGRTFTLVVTPVENADYVNVYGIDITERKKAEEKLSQLISTVSHELRTPITVLLMSLEYFSKHKANLTDDLEEKLLDGISRNVNLLNKLSEDILLFSRIDEQRLELEWEEYNPLEIITEVLFLMEPIGMEKNINFEIDVGNHIHLRGDPKRIDQIFRIIIDNAIKYSSKDSKVEISAIEYYQGKYNLNKSSGVLFKFKDYGRGISKEDLPHVFERFFRASNVNEISGTGLGLTIAKDLVESHRGHIFVESELDVGTTIYVFLPYVE
ncbi:MAG: PAS domain S-box protein [Promethearchaeota archaeon]|nr:MAG: PAS domain S-box protein [Candidatus Lokiarchaeota archaeon]